MKRQKAFIFFAFLLASLFVVSVQARGGTFNVEPTQEAKDTIKLGVSDSIVGNVSVYNGQIDFCISDPSGDTVLCYNKTSFEFFNLTAEENGVYTIHLVNNCEAENVTVSLSYGVNLNFVGQADITFGASAGTAVVFSIAPTPPFDWLEFFRVTYLYIGGAITSLVTLWKLWKDRNWKKKYRNVIVARPPPL
jgi:hypothetical protein